MSRTAMARAIFILFVTFMMAHTCLAMHSATRLNDQNPEGARNFRHIHQARDSVLAERGDSRAVAEIRMAENRAKILEGRFSAPESEDRRMSRTGEF